MLRAESLPGGCPSFGPDATVLPFRPIGTSCANREETYSGASDPTRKTWGGARNRRDRISLGLSSAQVWGIVHATEKAQRIGRPLNSHITVHWGVAGIADKEAGAATGRLLKLMRQWLHTRGHAFAYAYAREHEPDAGKGSHVHILVHLPKAAARDFHARQRAWLRRVTGRAYACSTIKSRRVVGFGAGDGDALYRANLAAVTAYLVKGATDEAALAAGLVRRSAPGAVTGKRAGWSENLSANRE